MILNQAEFSARTGRGAQAFSLLNAVRNRSVTTVTGQYAPGSLVGMALVRAILNERRIEFVGEGFRWSDISRISLTLCMPPLLVVVFPPNSTVSYQVR